MPALPRTGFNSSQLVRLLASLDIADGADAPGAGQTFAERLSHWLDWTDAIALFGALEAGPAPGAPAAQGASPLGPSPVIEDFRRVRTELALSIAEDTVFAADDTDFPACRRAYVARQQAMDARIAPLRGRLRAALAARSPALGQLAALDAVLDRALGERERHLLAKLPALLERHFARLRQASPATAAATAPGRSDPPDPRLQAAALHQTLRSVLLAELDLRLQPATGLAEALALTQNAVARP